MKVKYLMCKDFSFFHMEKGKIYSYFFPVQKKQNIEDQFQNVAALSDASASTIKDFNILSEEKGSETENQFDIKERS